MIDLHLHSTCSDGSDEPAAIVELAKRASCSALALTDHDTLEGLEQAGTRARELGIEFVPGCEVSCSWRSGQLHLLCYFVTDSGTLEALLSRFRHDRSVRNLELVERLFDLGIDLSYEEVQAQAEGGVVGRPHFAARLVARGHVQSISEAFDRYLSPGGLAYVPRRHVDPKEVIEAAHDQDAVVVLAHPLSLGHDLAGLADELVLLRKLGLDGLECHYASYDQLTRHRLVGLADANDLVATGGSDYHGHYKPGLAVGTGRGDLLVDDEVLSALASRRSKSL